MKINLKPEQAQIIQETLKSGKYQDIDDLITEALQLLAKRDQSYAQWLKETQAKIDVGIKQLDNGEGIDSTIVINQLKEKIAHLRQTQS